MTRQRICKIQREWVRSLKAASPAVAFILLTPSMESAHVNTCRCELISFLHSRVLQNLLTKKEKKAHTLYMYDEIIKKAAKNMKLYKYKSLENLAYFLDIIVRKRLYGATIKELNDPMEGYFSSETFNNKDWERIKELKKGIRICSLSTNNNNALLWAHYANEHKGCCIEIEVPNEKTWRCWEVNYCSSFPKLCSGQSDEEIIEMLFKTKSDYWSYENEVRFVKRMPLSKDGKPHKANLPVKVKKIYLGVRVTTEEKDRITRIVNAIDSSIVVEKMNRKDINFWRDQ